MAAALVTTTGIATIRRFGGWGHRTTACFMCLAASVLISASFLHMIPKAFSLNPTGPARLFAGRSVRRASRTSGTANSCGSIVTLTSRKAAIPSSSV